MKFKRYLNKQYPVLISVLSCVSVFGVLFYFMKLDMQIFYCGIQLITFFMFIYFIILYFNFDKEEKYKQKLEEAEHRIIELENEILKERNDIHDYFLMWVHQIKTPITAATLISKDDEENAEQRCSNIRQELIHIEDYTNMVLNYLKVMNPSSDMEFGQVKLDDIIKKILKRYSVLFIYNHIRLTYEPINEMVLTDAKWTSVMIEQILANAIKYAKGKEITISFDSKEKKLYIRDTGIGIREEDLPKIFDKGFSGFNGRLNEKSTGLGLFLVDKIAKRLNQKVKVKAELSKGSTFSIQFNELNLSDL